MIPPGSPRADEWLGGELSRPEHWRVWWPLLKRRVADAFGGEAVGAGASSALAVLVALVVLAAVIGIAAYVTHRRLRRAPAAAAGGGGVFDDDRLSAQEYRRRAAEHTAAGRHAQALLDAYRALSAQATGRDLVHDAPDLTAADVARALVAAYGREAGEILAAQRLFDEVRYGDAPCSAAQAARVAALDGRLADAVPSAPAPGTLPAVPSLPR